MQNERTFVRLGNSVQRELRSFGSRANNFREIEDNKSILRLDPNHDATPITTTPITTGLVRVLELLEEELVVDMALLGVTRVDQITPAYVCKAAPVTFPHEMSAFVHIPGGQLR